MPANFAQTYVSNYVRKYFNLATIFFITSLVHSRSFLTWNFITNASSPEVRLMQVFGYCPTVTKCISYDERTQKLSQFLEN